MHYRIPLKKYKWISPYLLGSRSLDRISFVRPNDFMSHQCDCGSNVHTQHLKLESKMIDWGEIWKWTNYQMIGAPTKDEATSLIIANEPLGMHDVWWI